MKKSIRNFFTRAVMLTVSMLTLSLSACGNSVNDTQTKSLYEQGLEVVQLMDEMTQSEDYIDLFTGNSEVKSVVQNISAGDYTAPKAVYAISLTDESDEAMAELYQFCDDGSEEFKSYLTDRIYGSLITQINGRGGTENLAAASACTAGKTFVNEDAAENVIYLYTYENAVPVAVTFIVGEDSAVSASGVFVMYDEFPCDSADEIKSFLDFFKVEVTEVSPE